MVNGVLFNLYFGAVKNCKSLTASDKTRIINPRFCRWVYWLLKAQLYSAVQVCDATGDAIKIYCRAQKISTAKFGLIIINLALNC